MSDPDTEPQAWIGLPDPDVVAASRPVDHPYNFGFATGMVRLLAAHPQIGPAFMQVCSAIMFAPGHLDRHERELPDLSPRSRALCEVAEKLSAQPLSMTENDWRPLRQLGFDDLACLEVTHLVGSPRRVVWPPASRNLEVEHPTGALLGACGPPP